ncbi:MAG: YbjN domain-containing protein [Euzebyaceae bacterium]|nr:YbjN domain-containing protein [Euzebyaceae bacterium]
MQAQAEVESWFASQPELDVERIGGSAGSAVAWFTLLHGERKRTIPVYLELGAHNLVLESFFMATPDERRDEVYGYLLQRNLRSYLLRFALHDAGDVLLVGVLPRHAVTADELDRVLGQLLTVADESYWQAIRLGFGGYIEREQAWRARAGMGPNPIS